LKRDDACLAAVTGKAALGDDSLRKEHCSSFIKTIVTPAAITVTTTITDAPSASEWSNYKRDVTVCPNEVPNYASACNEAGYKSACSVYGISGETTLTIPASTTTKTVYVGTGGKGGNGGVCTSTTTSVFSVTKSGCSGGTTTATVTETAAGSTKTITTGGSTVTVTANGTSGEVTKTVTVTATSNSTGTFPTGTGTPDKCLTDDQAKEFTDAFTTLLEYTSYNGTQGPPGRGYRYDVSAQYLAADFQDYSDSINWMAGFPLGGVTFNGRAAFDYGQGILQPELAVDTLLVSHNCKEITWRWHATTPSQASIIGINHMVLTSDLTQIQTNYAEFDNAAWLSSFGLQCKVPASNTTTASSRRMLI